MDSSSRISYLQTAIMNAKDAYYNGFPIITDAQFDALEDELKVLDPLNPVLQFIGAFSTKGNPIKHFFPMLSQDKALTKEDAWKFISMYIAPQFTFILSEKLDGMSVNLFYQDGELQMASTRGDGETGSDILSKASCIVPHSIPEKSSVHVRGELVISRDGLVALNKLLKEPIANTRNGVVGIINEPSMDFVKLRYVEFRAYEALYHGENPFGSYKAKLEKLSEWGFAVPYYAELREDFLTREYFDAFLDTLTEERFSFVHPFDIDGAIIRVDDEAFYESLGSTAHHPRGSIAWKFAASEIPVKIQGIEWSVGTSTISPIATFEPIMIDGANVGRVSLKSIKNMIDLGAGVGSTITLVRSGGVIPWAKSVVEGRKSPEDIIVTQVPSICPKCHSPLVFTTKTVQLKCDNPTCVGKFARKLELFVKMFEMDWFGPGVCDALVEGGVRNFSRVFTLTSAEIQSFGLGSKLSVKLYNEILNKREITFDRFLAAFSIEGLGLSTAQEITKQYKDVSTLAELTWLHAYSKFGTRYSGLVGTKLSEGLNNAYTEMCRVLEHVKVHPVEERGTTSLALSGVIIVITGDTRIPRGKWKLKIEQLGGRCASAVSKNTNYLVSNDTSKSSKYKKALELQVPIINEDKLKELCGIV